MSGIMRVLVADDEPMYRTLLEKTIAAEGFDVEVAVDGQEAIDRLQASEFDIVLTDLAMPRKSGTEVLRAAKKLNKNIIVIIITGFASLDTALAAIKDGVYDYITKPFQIDEIKLTLKNASERVRLEADRASLELKLEQAYETIEDLTNKRQNNQAKHQEIDQQIAVRQKELTDSMRRLRTFQDRLLPVQLIPKRLERNEEKRDKEEETVVGRMQDAAKLHREGAINDDEFRLLKKRILSE
ncbi:MAG: response regulator [Myxococcales bacterium]|nr:response regulator [Myxococcales bacterium]